MIKWISTHQSYRSVTVKNSQQWSKGPTCFTLCFTSQIQPTSTENWPNIWRIQVIRLYFWLDESAEFSGWWSCPQQCFWSVFAPGTQMRWFLMVSTKDVGIRKDMRLHVAFENIRRVEIHLGVSPQTPPLETETIGSFYFCEVGLLPLLRVKLLHFPQKQLQVWSYRGWRWCRSISSRCRSWRASNLRCG